MATLDLTTENFDRVISGNDIVIIDFRAPRCAPCRTFAPTFEEAGARPAAALDTLIEQFGSTDMTEMHAEIASQS